MFKPGKACLNLVFFLFNWFTKAKELSLAYYLLIAGGWECDEEMESCLFQGHYREVKCKQTRLRFELGKPISYTTTINMLILCIL